MNNQDKSAISDLISSSPNPKYEHEILNRLATFKVPVNDVTYHDIVVLSFNLVQTNRHHSADDKEHIMDAILTNVVKQYHNMYTHQTAYHYYPALVVLTEFRLIVVSDAPELQYSAGGISLARITKVNYHKNSLIVNSPEIHSDMGFTRLASSLHLITQDNNKFYAKMNHDIINMIMTYYPSNNILSFSNKKRKMFWICLCFVLLLSVICLKFLSGVIGFIILLIAWSCFGVFAMHIAAYNYATGHGDSGIAAWCFNTVNHISKNER